MVQTVPPIANVEVSVDEVRSRTDATGLAVVNVNEPGNHELSIRSKSTDPEARVSFALWSDGSTVRDRVVDVSSFTHLQAGFTVSRKVDFRILDEAGRPIDRPADSITIVDNTGRERLVTGDSSSWVPGNRLVSEPDGLTSQLLSWRIANVVVEGQSIDRINASDFSSGEGLWSVRLDPDAAASGVAGDNESGGGAGSTNWLYPIVAAVLLGAVVLLIVAGRGAESPRNRRSFAAPLRLVAARLTGALSTAGRRRRNFAAPLKSAAARLRGVLRVAKPERRDFAAPLKRATAASETWAPPTSQSVCLRALASAPEERAHHRGMDGSPHRNRLGGPETSERYPGSRQSRTIHPLPTPRRIRAQIEDRLARDPHDLPGGPQGAAPTSGGPRGRGHRSSRGEGHACEVNTRRSAADLCRNRSSNVLSIFGERRSAWVDRQELPMNQAKTSARVLVHKDNQRVEGDHATAC